MEAFDVVKTKAPSLNAEQERRAFGIAGGSIRDRPAEVEYRHKAMGEWVISQHGSVAEARLFLAVFLCARPNEVAHDFEMSLGNCWRAAYGQQPFVKTMAIKDERRRASVFR